MYKYRITLSDFTRKQSGGYRSAGEAGKAMGRKLAQLRPEVNRKGLRVIGACVIQDMNRG